MSSAGVGKGKVNRIGGAAICAYIARKLEYMVPGSQPMHKSICISPKVVHAKSNYLISLTERQKGQHNTTQHRDPKAHPCMTIIVKLCKNFDF